MADLLSTIGLSSSYADAQAKRAAAAQAKASKKQLAATKKGTEKGLKAIKGGVTSATGALAPAILNAGNYVGGQNLGYNVGQSAYGITDPALAAEAFNRSLSPLRNRAFEDIARRNANAGILGGGGTQTDIADYIAQNEFDPWRREVAAQYDPYQAIALQGTLGGKQADIYTRGAENVSNLNTGLAAGLSNIFGDQGTNQANLYNQYAANTGQVGSNILGLAGNIIGAGATLAGMRTPGGAAKLPQYASNNAMSNFGWGGA